MQTHYPIHLVSHPEIHKKLLVFIIIIKKIIINKGELNSLADNLIAILSKTFNCLLAESLHCCTLGTNLSQVFSIWIAQKRMEC